MHHLAPSAAALLASRPGSLFLSVPLTVLAAGNEGGIVKAQASDGKLYIRALASTPRTNSYGFRIRPSAWEGALAAFRENPTMLAYHRPDWPLGLWDRRQEVTPEGLVLEGWIGEDEPKIQAKVLNGSLARVSVWFVPLGEEQADDGVTEVTKARLYSADLVPIPADSGTMVEPLSAPAPVAAATERVPAIEVPVLYTQDVADACRAALGSVESMWRASRIAAGLRRATIQGEVK